MSENHSFESLTFSSLWETLSDLERQDACSAFWKSSSGHKEKTVEAVVNSLAKVKNFRPKSVRSKPNDWKAKELCRLIIRYPLSEYLGAVLVEYVLEKKNPMVCQILDAQGTRHQNGWIEDEVDELETEDILRGLKKAQEAYQARDIHLYYGLVFLYSSDELSALVLEASMSDEFQKFWESYTGHCSTEEAEDTSEFSGVDYKLEEENEDFTTLDTVLIRTVIASISDSEGAPDSDGIDDLIQEVITLNPARHHSNFHLGYVDALRANDVSTDFGGATSMYRRGWYFTGYLMGTMRTLSTDVLAVIANHPKLWEELMNQGPNSARSMLMPHILERAVAKKDWVIHKYVLERGLLPLSLMQAQDTWLDSFNVGAHLVREGNSSDAIPIFRALARHIEGYAGFDKKFRHLFSGRIERKLGQAYLRSGDFGRAKAILSELLERPDFGERANILTDTGIAWAGYRSLEFTLPKQDWEENSTTRSALEAQSERFLEACECAGNTTNAHFLIGLIAFYSNDITEAESHLSVALRGMLRNEAAYQVGNLVDWTRMLLAIVIGESLQPARFKEFENLVGRAIESRVSFHLHLWRRVLVAADPDLYDDTTLRKNLLLHLLTNRGDEAYQTLRDSSMLVDESLIRGPYSKWLEEQDYSPSELMREYRALADAALAGHQSNEIEDYLDRLESFAHKDSSLIPRFIEYLNQNRSSILRVWDESDIDMAGAGLHELVGEIDEAASKYEKVFYRHLSLGDEDHAIIILEKLKALESTSVDVNNLSKRLNPSENDEQYSSELRDCADISVLFVGGNEKQKRMEDDIREGFRKSVPGATLEFYFPGWDSGWNRHLDNVKRLLPKANVVVMQVFMRTQFGRGLRKQCGPEAPWLSCTGHGKSSILRSLEKAVLWEQDRRKTQQ